MTLPSIELTPIIVALFGLLGVVIQSIVTYKMNKSNRIEQKKRKKEVHSTKINTLIKNKLYRFGSKKLWLNVIILLIFIGLFSFGVKITISQFSRKPKAEITLKTTTLPSIVDLYGKCKNIDPNNRFLWIVVYSKKDKLFFPSCTSVKVDIHKRTWYCRDINVGLSGEIYTISLLLVENRSETDSLISNYCRDPTRHGLTDLKTGINILDSKEIQVINN
jgi:hypothetical protein